MAKLSVLPIKVFDASEGTTVHFETFYPLTLPSPMAVNAEQDDSDQDIVEIITVDIYDGLTGRLMAEKSDVVSHLDNGRWVHTPEYGFVIPGKFQFEKDWVKNSAFYYYLKIKTSNGQVSESAYFSCKGRPAFLFSNLDKDAVNRFRTSVLNFYLASSYYTGSVDKISSYEFFFYDGEKTVIAKSKTFYGTPSERFAVNGIGANGTYFVRATGKTTNGYELDTGYVQLYIDVDRSDSRNLLSAAADPRTGDVTLKSRLISLDGEPSGAVVYVESKQDGASEQGNYAVDLTYGQVSYNLPPEITVYQTDKFCLKAVVSPVLFDAIGHIAADKNMMTVQVGPKSYNIAFCKRFFKDGDLEKEYVYVILYSDGYMVVSNKIAEHGYDGDYLVDILLKDGAFSLKISEAMEVDQ